MFRLLVVFLFADNVSAFDKILKCLFGNLRLLLTFNRECCVCFGGLVFVHYARSEMNKQIFTRVCEICLRNAFYTSDYSKRIWS